MGNYPLIDLLSPIGAEEGTLGLDNDRDLLKTEKDGAQRDEVDWTVGESFIKCLLPPLIRCLMKAEVVAFPL